MQDRKMEDKKRKRKIENAGLKMQEK